MLMWNSCRSKFYFSIFALNSYSFNIFSKFFSKTLSPNIFPKVSFKIYSFIFYFFTNFSIWVSLSCKNFIQILLYLNIFVQVNFVCVYILYLNKLYNFWVILRLYGTDLHMILLLSLGSITPLCWSASWLVSAGWMVFLWEGKKSWKKPKQVGWRPAEQSGYLLKV